MENNETAKEEFSISGNDIKLFFGRIFRSGLKRKVVFRNAKSKRLFGLNIIISALIFFFVPIITLITIVILIVCNYSISIEKVGS